MLGVGTVFFCKLVASDVGHEAWIHSFQDNLATVIGQCLSVEARDRPDAESVARGIGVIHRQLLAASWLVPMPLADGR